MLPLLTKKFGEVLAWRYVSFPMFTIYVEIRTVQKFPQAPQSLQSHRKHHLSPAEQTWNFNDAHMMSVGMLFTYFQKCQYMAPQKSATALPTQNSALLFILLHPSLTISTGQLFVQLFDYHFAQG